MGQRSSGLSWVFKEQQGPENGGVQVVLDTQKEMSPEIEELQGPKLQLKDNANKNINLLKQMDTIIEIQIQEIKKFNSILHTQCKERAILEQRLICAEKIIHTLGRNMEENEQLEKQQDRISDEMQQLEKCLKKYLRPLENCIDDLAHIRQEISEKGDAYRDLDLELEICKSERNLLAKQLSKANVYIEELEKREQEVQLSRQSIQDQTYKNLIEINSSLNENKKLEDANFVLEKELENQEQISQSVPKQKSGGITENFRKIFRPYQTFKEKVQRREEELNVQLKYCKIRNANLKQNINNLLDVNFKLDMELENKKQRSEEYISQKEKKLKSVKTELNRENYLKQIKTSKAERHVIEKLGNCRNKNCNQKKQIKKMKGAIVEFNVEC